MRPLSMSMFSPSVVVCDALLSFKSSAVGPSKILPYTVGLMSTPLVTDVGTGSST